MAAYKAITACYSNLVTEVSLSVDSIADKCKEECIIGDGTYNDAVDSNKPKDTRARILITAVSDRIKTQGDDVFKKFIDILSTDLSLSDIVHKLQDTFAKMMPKTQCTDSPDSGASNYRSPIQPTLSVDEAAPVVFGLDYSVPHIRPASQELRQENSELRGIIAEQKDKISAYESSLKEAHREKNEALHKLNEVKEHLKMREKQNDEEKAEMKQSIKELRTQLAQEEQLARQREEKIENLMCQLQKKEEDFGRERVDMMKQICDLREKVKDKEVLEKELEKQIVEANLKTEKALKEVAYAKLDNVVKEKLEQEAKIEELQKEIEHLRLKAT